MSYTGPRGTREATERPSSLLTEISYEMLLFIGAALALIAPVACYFLSLWIHGLSLPSVDLAPLFRELVTTLYASIFKIALLWWVAAFAVWIVIQMAVVTPDNAAHWRIERFVGWVTVPSFLMYLSVLAPLVVSAGVWLMEILYG